MLKRLVATLWGLDNEIIVVDDADLLLAAKRNKGAAKATANYLLFIDDDNYVEEGAVSVMLKDFDRKFMGVMGMTACYSDKKRIVSDGGSWRHDTTGFITGLRTNEKTYDYEIVRNVYQNLNYYHVDEVANAFMIPRSVFDEVGGFDEENFPIDLDEADICRRISKMGYKIVMNPYAICYHEVQTYSRIPNFRRPMNAYFMGRNRILFQLKHLPKLELVIYFMIFFPIFYFSYVACLLYRRKPWMVVHFTKGVYDGLRNCKKNKYQP